MRRILIALVLLLSAAGVSRAEAQRSHFGVHGGYNFHSGDWLIGAQIHMPVSRAIEFYPSFDYYLVDAGALVGFHTHPQVPSPRTPLSLGAGGRITRPT